MTDTQRLDSESWAILREYSALSGATPLDIMEGHMFWMKWKRWTRWLQTIGRWMRKIISR